MQHSCDLFLGTLLAHSGMLFTELDSDRSYCWLALMF